MSVSKLLFTFKIIGQFWSIFFLHNDPILELEMYYNINQQFLWRYIGHTNLMRLVALAGVWCVRCRACAGTLIVYYLTCVVRQKIKMKEIWALPLRCYFGADTQLVLSYLLHNRTLGCAESVYSSTRKRNGAMHSQTERTHARKWDDDNIWREGNIQ
jgi:hypothetical protein